MGAALPSFRAVARARKIGDAARFTSKTAGDKGALLPSSTYLQLREAIIHKQQVSADYKGHHRVMCPHAIGTEPNGNEQLMAYQFDGTSSTRTNKQRIAEALATLLPSWEELRVLVIERPEFFFILNCVYRPLVTP